MKKAYKQLCKKLNDGFTKSGNSYDINGSVGKWVHQCGIKATSEHTEIICIIFGSVPYPYQQADRKTILKYLKKNKYKDYTKLVKAKAKLFKAEQKRHKV